MGTSYYLHMYLTNTIIYLIALPICCGADYNPEYKEHCPTSCGSMDIPFPFGLKEGCYANIRFQLNCRTDNTTVLRTTVGLYRVTRFSLEDGTLTVNNMMNNASSEKELTSDDEIGYQMEDEFGFSMEYDIVIKWAVTNSTCQQASQKNNTKYACRSVHSGCEEVTHRRRFMGYRCSCSSGFHGNPYIQNGCQGSTPPPSHLIFYNLYLYFVLSQILDKFWNKNPAASNTCMHIFITISNMNWNNELYAECTHNKEFDPEKRRCVTSSKQRNLVLGKPLQTIPPQSYWN